MNRRSVSASDIRNRDANYKSNRNINNSNRGLSSSRQIKDISNKELLNTFDIKFQTLEKQINEIKNDKTSKKLLEIEKESLKVQKESLEEQKEAEYDRKHTYKQSLRSAAVKAKQAGVATVEHIKKLTPSTAKGLLSGVGKLIAGSYLAKKFWPLLKKELFPFMLKHWKMILGALAIKSFIKDPLKFMAKPFKAAIGVGGFIYNSMSKMVKGLLTPILGAGGLITKGIKKLSGFAGAGINKLRGSVIPIDGFGNKAGTKSTGKIGKGLGSLKRFAGKGMKGALMAMKSLARFVPFLGVAVLAWDVIDTFFPNFWSKISEMFSIENIGNIAGNIKDMVSNGLSKIFDMENITALGNTIKDKIVAGIDNVFGVDNIVEIGTKLKDNLMSGLDNIGNWFSEKFSNIGNFIASYVRDSGFPGSERLASWLENKEKKPSMSKKTKEALEYNKVLAKDKEKLKTLTRIKKSMEQAIINNKEAFKSGKVTKKVHDATFNALNNGLIKTVNDIDSLSTSVSSRKEKVIPKQHTAIPKHKALANIRKSSNHYDILDRNATIAAKELGIPKEVILAQQIQENGWKKKKLTGKNNFFNIKADASWKGPKSKHKVWEIENGKKVWKYQWFRDYNNPEDSARDYAKFLKKNKRYKNVIGRGLSKEQVAIELQKAGYATDPNYAKNIINIMHGKTFNRRFGSESAGESITNSTYSNISSLTSNSVAYTKNILGNNKTANILPSNIDYKSVKPGKYTGKSLEGVVSGAKLKLDRVCSSYSSLFIVSGYRSPSYNKKVGGASKSMHMKGKAIDVAWPDKSQKGKELFVKKALDAGFNGIGIYPGFMHMDIGSKRAWGPNGSSSTLPGWASSIIGAHRSGKGNEPAVALGDKEANTTLGGTLNSIDQDTFGLAKNVLKQWGVIDANGNLPIKGNSEKSSFFGNLFGSNKGNTSNSKLGGILNSIDQETFGLAKNTLSKWGIIGSNAGSSGTLMGNIKGMFSGSSITKKHNSILDNIILSTNRKTPIDINSECRRMAQVTKRKETPIEQVINKHNAIVSNPNGQRPSIDLNNSDYNDKDFMLTGVLF